MEETDEAGNVNLYPNPNTGRFSVEAPDADQIQIINSVGQIVQQVSIKNTPSASFSLKEKGVYFIRIYSEDNTITKKLVVQ